MSERDVTVSAVYGYEAGLAEGQAERADLRRQLAEAQEELEKCRRGNEAIVRQYGTKLAEQQARVEQLESRLESLPENVERIPMPCRRCQEYQARIATLEAALRAWEKWEGDIIADPDCWPSDDCLPRITQALWDRVVDELQPIRNAALSASPSPLVEVGQAAVAWHGQWAIPSSVEQHQERHRVLMRAVDALLRAQSEWGQ